MLNEIISKIDNKSKLSLEEYKFVLEVSDELFEHYKTKRIFVLDFGNYRIIDVNGVILESLGEDVERTIIVEFLLENKPMRLLNSLFN